jgi:hypothetical protein
MNPLMNRRYAFLMIVAVMVGAVSSASARAEQVDNPQYASWAKHKPGTSVTMHHETTAMGMAMIQQTVQTLADVTPDKVTIELTVTMEMAGQKHDMKQKRDIPAKVEKGQEYLPPGYKGTVKELPSEPVEIAGKSYDCKVFEFSGESDKGKANGKVWRNTGIPGDVAKMDMTVQGQQQATIKMTVTAIEIK